MSMGFLRQESWSGLPFPSPRDLPNSGIFASDDHLFFDWSQRTILCVFKINLKFHQNITYVLF